MTLESKPKRFGHHNNAFGALRLLFASMVILAHTSELRDGDRSREPLTLIFGTMSFGELAVDCFFIVSGYLISSSFLNSKSLQSYLVKRVARIYPAFVAVFMLCAFVVAPLGGGDLPNTSRVLARLAVKCLLLQSPEATGAFEGTAYPVLNGSLWTIAYEFRCYLLVVALGTIGILQRRYMLLALTAGCLLATFAFPVPIEHVWHDTRAAPLPASAHFYSFNELKIDALGRAEQTFRLMSAFLAGACFYAFRGQIRFTGPLVTFAAIGLFACMFSPRLAESAVVVFGTYLIFAVAQRSGPGWLTHINNENDVSYGIYLYAWPVTKLLDWWLPGLSLIILIVATWLISWVFGWASWKALEKPVMERIRPVRAVS